MIGIQTENGWFKYVSLIRPHYACITIQHFDVFHVRYVKKIKLMMRIWAVERKENSRQKLQYHLQICAITYVHILCRKTMKSQQHW